MQKHELSASSKVGGAYGFGADVGPAMQKTKRFVNRGLHSSSRGKGIERRKVCQGHTSQILGGLSTHSST